MDAGNTKVYVAVRVDFRADGVMLPRSITWEDGCEYEIDKVAGICHAHAARAGSLGDRYTVYIQGKQSYLYFEHCINQTGYVAGRWFVERKSA